MSPFSLGRFLPHTRDAATVRRRWPLALVSALVLVVASGADQGDQQGKPGEPGKKLAEKKLLLFNGKTLDGWKKTNFGGEGEVKVKNAAVTLGLGSSLTGITSTRKDLPTTNYELCYEAMRVDGYDFFAAATFPVGKSHATLVNGGWGGSVTGVSSIDGYDASENETSAFFDYKDKKWYKFRVRVTDETIRCWVDDKRIVDVKHKGRRVDTRIEVDLCKPLGFASWETTGALRNIEMRTLQPEEIAETNKTDE